MAAVLKTKISPAEYLKIDFRSDHKNEYFDGQIYMMAGASANRNLIAVSLGVALHTRLRNRGCSIYASDMRVKVEETESYTYPDVSVVCGQPRYENTTPETLLNPKVIFEILSPSTEQHDRGLKLRHYRKIDSLTDYILVSQSAYHLEQHARQPDDTWLLTDIIGREAVLHLPSLNCEIELAEIYQQVSLEPVS